MVPVVIGIISVRDDKECSLQLEKDGIVTMGYMSQYYKSSNGSTLYATIVYSNGNNTYYERSPNLYERFPLNMPVYVKYSASDPECVVVLMDSTVIVGSKKIRYHKIRFKGWDYKVEDLNK